ncbi:1-phosphofructokinase [Neobacillus cucumis]|uniref:1-phosphofructokinase n=1 Tax=Neobacillus cucumis TaxID=1740721 RepID=UPI00203FA53E|nr:1-phosphofructokinase [Neobacillus cucumis]MCM3729360.1 1-phosphofructokinase [Neobacillus cucumis]
MIPIIYTCTLNTAIDLFMDVDSLHPSVVNRTNTEDYQPNGKTINVSIMLKRLGVNNTALGFIGGFTGKYIESELQKLGIITDFTEIEGITRVNAFVRAGDQEFKLVNKGPEISLDKKTELINKINKIPKGSLIVVSGSFPRGITDDIYEEIANVSKQNELRLVLDISSKKLLNCLRYHPYLVKPNREELASFFGKNEITDDELLELGKEIIKMGAQRVLVSLGEEGSLYISESEVVRVTTPQGKVINTACAGDALLASFLGKIVLGETIEEALRFASATGAATAFSMGLADLEDVPGLMKSINVYHITQPIN